MHSALYTGSLRHRRFAPRRHEFSYKLFMVYIDLAELSDAFRGRWLWSTTRPAVAWLRRGDFLGDASMSIDDAVRERVAAHTGTRPTGPIRMLTHLRYFGVSFNPVTFYYCYDAAGASVEFILAEITNTPWRERHAYVLSDVTREPHARLLKYRFDKSFHVSPFMSMNLSYDWRFSPPGERLTVHMQNFEGDGKLFDATLDLARREITAAALAEALLRFPCMSASVVGAIYWQALRLSLKRIPFHSHPAGNPDHAGHIGT
ncbi:MAG TPA: DUF1365 domain-containing protein, partial [Polyangiales bacterium]|nr:DUF1365 domain-containing protein [Polyangiales bacterium]